MNQLVIRGWFRNLIVLKTLCILKIYDGSDLKQIITRLKIPNCKQSYVDLKVSEVQTPKGLELELVNIEDFKIINLAQKELIPYELGSKNSSNFVTRRHNRVYDLKDYNNQNLLKNISKLTYWTHQFFQEREFCLIDTPKITPTGAEGGAEVFKIKYYDQIAYLAQSPQLYKQMMLITGLQKVYEIGHIYRAQKSDTNRHLSEATCLDLEMITENLKEVMKNAEAYLLFIHKKLNKIDNKIIYQPTFKYFTYSQIIKKYQLEPGSDLDSHVLNLISQNIDEDYYFITHWPTSLRPFYTKKSKDESFTESFDLMAKDKEIVSGSLREENYSKLEASAKENKINIEGILDYLNAFKIGAPPMGGLGLGYNRLVMILFNLENVRETLPFPRTFDKLNP